MSSSDPADAGAYKVRIFMTAYHVLTDETFPSTREITITLLDPCLETEFDVNFAIDKIDNPAGIDSKFDFNDPVHTAGTTA